MLDTIPEWEQSVLWVISQELSSLENIHVTSRLINRSWEREYWYGIEVWRHSLLVAVVYAYNHRLLLFRNERREVFDLTDPGCFESLIAWIVHARDNCKKNVG